MKISYLFKNIILQIINLIIGIFLGYLISIRTNLNETFAYVLESGILIIFLLVVIAVIAKKGKMITVSYGIFGLAFAVGLELLPKIFLFLEVGDNEYQFLIVGMVNMMMMTAFFLFIGFVIEFSYQHGIFYKLIAIFPIGGAIFSTITTYYSKDINSVNATVIESMIALIILILIFFGWVKKAK
ncbi:hypothetical protein DW241_17080 [Hungatella hathewayi]|uniref:hypothetical protein n=1 Tax=Anaerostipes faecis TaxID=2880702 RepID=UPI000EDB608B|nr:hypothetical protein [Anaerostipes faecis]RGC79680.1 hypothetical protein DW241_17080 [Hungatella hathewayi]